MEYQNHITLPTDSAIEMIYDKKANPLISHVEIRIAYVGANRNGSYLSKEVLRDMGSKLGGSMICGYYNENSGDFEEHNRVIEVKNGQWLFKDTTQAYGFVPINGNVWFQNFTDDGFEHEYLCCDAFLWTGVYPEAKKVITDGKNHQSMELHEESLKGSWAKLDNENMEYFIINEAVISKLCILGENVEPCFEGADIYAKTQFSMSEEQNESFTKFSMALQSMMDKGGFSMLEEDVKDVESLEDEEEKDEEASETVETEEEAEAEVEVEEETEVEEEVEEEDEPETSEEEEETSEDDKGNNAEYNLEEIQEYIDLKSAYSSLETSFNELKTKYDALVEFKSAIDRKEKEAMIDKFYMLSEEDKADVTENIDKYSLNEIEAKLSVICVRNRVSFDLDEGHKSTKDTTYSLDSSVEDDMVPDWVKAVGIKMQNK